MTQLLLETATDICSVAVAREGVVVAEHTADEAFQHSSHLTVFIRRVMEEAGLEFSRLDEIVLSDGPGSYTSLRVGAATAKGLCVALPGLALRVVPTLTALALAHNGSGEAILAVINSRRGEVFGQLFDGARPPVRSEGEERGLWAAPQNIRLTDRAWSVSLEALASVSVVGPGQERLLASEWAPPKLRAGSPQRCSATHLLAPASSPGHSRLVDIASYEPCYLNPPFVTKSRKKPLG